ncbi:AAA family ATPase [Lutibacter sp. TH_r2]|uniref:McrB family protein n=1 Tax=Lutibacter sp. TH_r2 TaxID=3082083 RepID=UPI0029548D93|nr:AAA family ATPase [Lutibacter sp. TH_r2]MDV7187424.1 AAA family ATPase [Lutibacter sp. TH_r2]
MIDYKEYEQKVYNWLIEKNKKDPNFTFSLRQNGSKGAKTDYFIGTEKSRYFGLTFWTIPVGFPGSSGDCIDLIFQVSADFLTYSYNFEFTQTNSPDEGQNTSVLNLIKSLETPLDNAVGNSYASPDSNKMCTIKTKSRKDKYSNLEEMLSDIDKNLELIIPIVDECIKKEKAKNPQFVAHRISQEEFKKMKEKLGKRFDKYSNLNSEMSIESNLKEEFQLWLNKTKKKNSNAVSSYLNAIEKLNDILTYNIYDINDIRKINSLYEDLIIDQRNKNGKYYNEKSPSYGLKGFYSAGVGKYLNFLKERFNKNIIKQDSIEDNNSKNMSLNQILYGPPGTGKTYNTINKALEIIDSSFLLENLKDRKQLTNRFKELRKREQIIFTTFHQSMSYEDFVEGIKPIIDENSENEKQISYEVISGIFKSSCAQAAYNCYLASKKGENKTNNYTFDTLYEAFLNYYNEANPKPYFESITGKPTEIFEINKNDSIRARAKGSVARHVAPLTKENLQKMYDSFSSTEEINSLKQIKETVGVSPRLTEFYAVFKGLKDFESNEFEEYKRENKEEEEISRDIETSQIIKKFDEGVFNQSITKFGKKAEPIVLIIDEINRGNISQIFGELITLIEKDKRMGNSEALEVKLPYSKKEFGVPPNLYIIGTMNTADRSVEALDTALRRRFVFKEMMPKPELIKTEGKSGEIEGIIENIDLEKLLITINKRIEKLIDRDHKIGHSYFLSVDSLDKLKDCFENKIVPLLQEYFFGDYGKIGLVLGEGFFENNQENENNVFANFSINNYDADSLSERQVFHLLNVIDMDTIEFLDAIELLLKNQSE